MPSHRGRRLRRRVAPVVPKRIVMVPMFRPMPISPFTCAPIRRRAQQIATAAPALLRPCGQATWRSINQQSVANGNQPLGFINPSLYSIGAGSSYTSDFHDITSGSNGYSATTGYDLATGWGSPNGSGLINALAGSSSTTAAAITSPSPSSTLTSATTTFTWSPGSGVVTAYYLHIGTPPAVPIWPISAQRCSPAPARP